MNRLKPQPMGLLLGSELFASAVGFGVMLTLAQRLGPPGFADFEYASAVAAWWLVLVRGGLDSIVYREAARRPRLIRPLTDLLIGLRLALAGVGLAAVLGFAMVSGGDRGWVVAMSGLVLIPSALASDVGLRASGRFAGLAIAQAVRASGLALGVAWLVSGTDRAGIAAACVFLAEVASSITIFLINRSEHGGLRPRFRLRAWRVLARRGAVAGVCRFARVGLYAGDLLILGLLATASLGPYAAARRLVFALLAIGLVVPSAIAPKVARAWVSGRVEARELIRRTIAHMMILALPATVGLIATSDRWMPQLFGDRFGEGGPWLALIAARLPFVLVSNVEQSALIACRREGLALRLILGMVVLALIGLPPLAYFLGVRGVAWGVLGVEVFGAVAGWFALRSLDVALPWHLDCGPAFAGCLGLVFTCWIGRGWPLAGVVVAGSSVYGLMVIGWPDRPAARGSEVGIPATRGVLAESTS